MTHSLLLLNNNKLSSLITNKRLLSHTLLKDIKQETKTNLWAEKLASDSHFT